MAKYGRGNLVNCRGEFRNPALPATDPDSPNAAGGALYDPVHVHFRMQDPTRIVAGTFVENIYPTDPLVIRDSIGRFRRQWQGVDEGLHTYQFNDPDAAEIAYGDRSFVIEDSPFPVP